MQVNMRARGLQLALFTAVLLLAAPTARVVSADVIEVDADEHTIQYTEYVPGDEAGRSEEVSMVESMAPAAADEEDGVGVAINNKHVRFTGSNCKGKPAPFHKVCWSERGIRREGRQDTKYGKLRCRYPKVRLWNYDIKKMVLVGICRVNTGGTLTHLCATLAPAVRCCICFVFAMHSTLRSKQHGRRAAFAAT